MIRLYGLIKGKISIIIFILGFLCILSLWIPLNVLTNGDTVQVSNVLLRPEYLYFWEMRFPDAMIRYDDSNKISSLMYQGIEVHMELQERNQVGFQNLKKKDLKSPYFLIQYQGGVHYTKYLKQDKDIHVYDAKDQLHILDIETLTFSFNENEIEYEIPKGEKEDIIKVAYQVENEYVDALKSVSNEVRVYLINRALRKSVVCIVFIVFLMVLTKKCKK